MSVTYPEVLEAFQKANEGLLAKLENKPESKVELHPEKGAKLAQESLPETKEGKSDMNAPALGGVVDGLDSLRIPVLNIAFPVGSALVGGVTGLVVGDVIDIVLPPPLDSEGRQTFDLSAKSLVNVGAQAAGAGAVLKWAPGIIGRGPAQFAAGVMVLRVILRIPAVLNFIDRASGALATPLASVKLGQVRGIQAEADRIAAGQFNDGVDQFAKAL